MNAAVRAVVRMGLYVGAKVYFIHEVSLLLSFHCYASMKQGHRHHLELFMAECASFYHILMIMKVCFYFIGF